VALPLLLQVWGVCGQWVLRCLAEQLVHNSQICID
jgi:hypothetical protein